MSDSTAEKIASLSFLEKIAVLSGKNTWETRAIPRLGIRSVWMSDGPHGVRKQVGSADHLGINASQPATCFPTAATIANSWDLELAERVAANLGREAAYIGVDVLLGPGINVKRSPLGGRNFEYFSEDPYLAGKFGAAYVRGIQSAGVAACPKHFAVNSQETRRMTSNSVVDPKTLREIYLTAFEMVVKESRPLTFMTSYNLVNGTYTNEHPQLLQELLREEWGFDGLVVTDWGGGNDALSAITAGSTVEMPSPGYDSVDYLMGLQATVDPESLDARVAEVIELAERLNPAQVGEEILAENAELARVAAEQSIVLLKNDGNILPLAPATSVAVIGAFAFEPRYQGAGSSLVNATALPTPLEALRESDLSVVAEARGFTKGAPTSAELVAEAKAAAASADVVLLYLGLDEISESEGKDRDSMELGANQRELLAELAAVNPKIVVVFSAGSAVEMPWLDQCQGLVHGYLGGQSAAPAVVNVLTGAVNPSGRLAETYPLSLADTPTAGNFPAHTKNALYKEGPFVGYRYYETAELPVLFPFGFGLSYTTFEYTNLTADENGVRLTVTNTGSVAGSDVPQLYVAPTSAQALLGPTPAIKLAGFAKVTLEPGESREVAIACDEYTFRAYDVVAHQWVTVAGEYTLSVGHNIRHRPLEATVTVAGAAVGQPAPAARIERYRTGRIQDVTLEEFATLLGTDVPAEPDTTLPLGVNSPLSDLKYAKSWLGRTIYSQYFLRSMKKAEKKGVPDLNLLFQYSMPFRAINKMSGGLADARMVDGILMIVNGHFFRGLGRVIGGFFANGKKQKKIDAQFTQLSTGTTTTQA